MAVKKKQIEFAPQFLKDKNGKITKVYMPYEVFDAITKKIELLKKDVMKLKKKYPDRG